MDAPTHRILVQLARLDGEVRRRDQRLAEGPTRQSELAARRQRCADDLAALEARVAELTRERRGVEQQAAAAAERIIAFERQLTRVTSNEEHAAMLRQIEDARSRRDAHESRALELMEAEETEAATFDERAAALRGRIDDLEYDAGALRDELAGLETDRQRLLVERAALMERLPADLHRIVDRLVAGKGVAVVPLRGGACGHCFANQPAQIVAEIRLGEELIFCQECGCILVADGEQEE